MKYRSETGCRHDSEERLGVLVLNLGTPDAPTVPAVRRYLAEFLSDPRIVELPRALWWPILHGLILRLRPRRSAASYRALWTEEGSPLLVIAQRQAESLQRRLDALFFDVLAADNVAIAGRRYEDVAPGGGVFQRRCAQK